MFHRKVKVTHTMASDASYIPSFAGEIQILGKVNFSIDSNPDEATLQFNLSCFSIGGPATTVSWSRDSETLTEGTRTVLDNAETAQYTHTLTLTGRMEGLYTCSVANEISNVSAELNVTGKAEHSFFVFEFFVPLTINHFILCIGNSAVLCGIRGINRDVIFQPHTILKNYVPINP